MHLTPGFVRAPCHAVRTLAAVTALSMAACGRRPEPMPPVPVPVPAAPTPIPTEPASLLILAADSAWYDVSSTVTTTERSAATSRIDSASYTEAMRLVLMIDATAGGPGTFRLRLLSDSGYALPIDRSAPPETIRKDTLPMISEQLLESNGTVRHAANADSTVCRSTSSLVSPLLTSSIALYLSRASHALAAASTELSYRICSAGVERHLVGTINHQGGTSGVRTSPTRIGIDARIDTDSSKALPMHLTGTLTGTATITAAEESYVLPTSILVETHSLFTAQSSIRQQRFEQRVVTRLTRRP